ncbi:MAG: hypothetical protein WD069_08080 [Planctomycetales bacterium]
MSPQCLFPLKYEASFISLALICVLGCTGSEPATGGGAGADAAAPQAQPEKEPARLQSADYVLVPADYEKFRKGRPMEEILKDLHWWGNFAEAGEIEGKNVSAISFGLFGGPSQLPHGMFVWAIFVDGRFEKFVRWPDSPPGLTAKVGEHPRLVQGYKAEAVTIADLEKEAKAAPAPPSSVDPGLTALGLIFGRAIEKRQLEEYKQMVVLRDQFNAARLKTGMTQKEVEEVLKSKPIESGEVKAGAFKFYGSTKSFDLNNPGYSNILTVFKDGKLTDIYSADYFGGVERGLRDARTFFVDLPPLEDE